MRSTISGKFLPRIHICDIFFSHMLASEDAHIAVCKGAGETKQVVYFIPSAWTGHYAIKVGLLSVETENLQGGVFKVATNT